MSNVDSAELNFRISGDNTDVSVSLISPDGRVQEKCISAEDLTASLARQHTMSTGIVPDHTRYFRGDKRQYVIAIEAPAKVRNFALYVNQRAHEEGDKYEPEELRMPMPRCIFFFKINNERIMNSYLYCLLNPLGTNMDRLYWFPFGNTWEDGRICWGSQSSMPVIKTPMALVGLIGMFFDLPYNGDLYNTHHIRLPDGITNEFFSTVRHFSGQDIFPSNCLADAGTTFNQVINRIR